MAKGLRSKSKRHFRAIKHKTVDTSTTAAVANALINNNNESSSTSSPLIEVEMTDSKKKTSSSKKNKKLTGSLLYSVLGLLDPDEISVTNTALSPLELLYALIDVEEFPLYEK
ncbi:3272_t:CDS:2 [Ambispora leptoticha]|uniref:3272_t:CDS:1 n=1 Tax=Ambispora leptoticha TaxID=144679 RepID=A0A9N8YVV2_9GLOM|nr:3272_t:CDS:2 [Ambispora leptoticha]